MVGNASEWSLEEMELVERQANRVWRVEKEKREVKYLKSNLFAYF